MIFSPAIGLFDPSMAERTALTALGVRVITAASLHADESGQGLHCNRNASDQRIDNSLFFN
jgi:hypothetical protein